MDHVPAIDIASFLDGSEKSAVARRVARACEAIGFLTVTGHGIAPSVIDRAFEWSRLFFDQPRTQKDRWHPAGTSRQRGYHGVATRALAQSLGDETPRDLRESYYIGPVDDHQDHFRSQPDAAEAYAPNIYPAEPPGAAEALVTLYRSFERLSADLLRVFAVALEQPEDYFSDHIRRHFSILATHHYPPLETPPAPGQLRGRRPHRLRRPHDSRDDRGPGRARGPNAGRKLAPGPSVARGPCREPRRHDGSLDERALDLDPASRRQPGRPGEPALPAPDNRVLHASRLRRDH